MAQASSTQVVASHRVVRLLKPYTQHDHNPSQEPEQEVLVHSLREHMNLQGGGPGNKRYNDAEVFDCSKAVVVRGGGGPFESGLLGAIKMAYAGSHCLRLRPDDIWLAIAQGVSAHLSHEKNAEKYRKVFVDHEGKPELVVDCTEFLTGEYSDKLFYNLPFQSNLPRSLTFRVDAEVF